MRSIADKKSQAEFLANLREKDAYETEPLRFRFADDFLLRRSDGWFYLREFLVVCVGSVRARLGRFDGAAWTDRAYRMMRLMEAAGARIRIEGAEHMIRQQAPTVYVANHMSMVETMVLPGGLIQPFHPVAVVVKKSLLTYPVFGAIMRAVQPIAVARLNPREDLKQVLEQGSACLRAGRSVLVFPQSTRRVCFRPAEFNSLGVKLAQRNGASLLPVAVRSDFQETGHRWRDVGPIARGKPILFRFGEPIPPETDPKHAHRQTIEFIAGSLREWDVPVPGTFRTGGPARG